MTRNDSRFEALSGRVLKLWSDGYMHGPRAERGRDVDSEDFVYVFVNSVRVDGDRGFVELVRKDEEEEEKDEDDEEDKISAIIYVGEREILKYGGEDANFRARCGDFVLENLYMNGSRKVYKELDRKLKAVEFGEGGFRNGFG